MPPTPKESSLRARRNKTTTRAVLSPRKNPKIPALPTGVKWHQQVRNWWRRAWSSPMVPEWTDSDIDALNMVALLLNTFWDAESTPNERRGLAGEIRQLLAQCGLTPMSRRSLQWEIDRGEAAAEATASRRAGKAPAKKAPAKPDPRVTKLRAV